MKKLAPIFMLVGLMMLCSCRGNKENQQEIKAPSVSQDSPVVNDSAVSDTAQSAPDSIPQAMEERDNTAELEASARQFVNDMYANVFRGAYAVNTKYFTPDFVSLYNRTEKLESQLLSEADGMLDDEFFSDEFWSSYNDDPKSMGAKATISNITISNKGKGKPTAKVTVRITPAYGNENPIKINLVMTDSGWKISDYRGFKASMKRYLSSY